MWKLLQRYRALDPEARKVFGHAATLLPLIALSLRLRGFNKTREALQKGQSAHLSQEQRKSDPARTVEITCRMVRAGAHYGPLHPTCLVESLALWHLLQKRGIPVRLRIGVRKLSGKFEAHAWVESEGVALNQVEEAHHHYMTFDSGFLDVPGEKS
jgi:hypothetical protein